MIAAGLLATEKKAPMRRQPNLWWATKEIRVVDDRIGAVAILADAN
ncbi:hypothetical protein HNQ72_004595 [Rhizobium wenxiniae]|uniref:Uncharacterized protein n=1 Tax=Rhizobium wenxiniae TaxID=1737357 RepID=A0A7W9YA26_9HYPH|nr:hypothetical protein [Rhizobium wenxiniae]